jgi:transcriptional regulator with XRE-family HTH domain
MRAALAAYDFGVVFRQVRLDYGLTQDQLAELFGVDQGRVSRIERGMPIHHIATIARIARVLGIPPALLGFDETTDRSTRGRELSWLDRGDFGRVVMGLVLGASGIPELKDLSELKPRRTDPTVPDQIDMGYVDGNRAVTACLRDTDYKVGGEMVRAAAKEHLRCMQRLRHATCTSQVKAELHLATAEAAMTAGWMSYDVEDHIDARHLWLIALSYAKTAEHPRSADLEVDVLLDMAHQYLHQNKPREAHSLVRTALATADTHAYPVSNHTRGYLQTNLAWCHGTLGHADACRRALDQAQQSYLDIDPTTAPPWAAHVVPAEIAAQQGHGLFLLALSQFRQARAHQHLAEQAIAHLRTAVDGYGSDYARSSAVNLPGLAGAYLLTGDLDAAVATGSDAIIAITQLSSTRAYARLKNLSDTAAAFTHRPDVVDLRQRIDSAITAA